MRIANAPLSYGAFEMTVGTDFPVPEPARVLAAMAAAGYAGTELGPPGYLGRRTTSGGLELVGGFVQIAFSDPDAGLDELHATLDAVRRRQARAPAGAVRRGRAGADRQPGPRRRGRVAAARRGALAHARRRRRARRRRGSRARLRAGLPSPHVDLRRGRGGDRAPARVHRRPAAARLRRTCSSPAATRCRRCATGASGSRRSTSRTCGSTCSRASRPSAPTR